ncbi:MAG: pyridoxamine 5'-phosphate oxidase family protein [Roseibium sp.]|uniref:FAD-binding oxidoreductase n=1 Tax=Roseibium sp. TaxID=1936156 RepID=UPI00260779A1|nr:pyridoxamine 5'-phosphate oxidase family protein [Roseibium sp.]MCV0427549.1 pyridoxamine 5'-phosphate oxidase family protein [Roseibium sp.]
MPAADLFDTSAKISSPFHKGEKLIQQRMGVGEIEHWARNAVRSYMPEQHREFFQAQPFLIISARDERGRPWATLLAGEPGFVSSATPEQLEIESQPVAGDALETALQEGADIGILGIELETRRRNRVNGRVTNKDGISITFAVGQSFGNCPQYIRARAFWYSSDTPEITVLRGAELSSVQWTWIESADTFFIASGYRGEGETPVFGMDVSHRGGERGFVEVLNSRKIRFPDYAGNNFYNTLGNLSLDPRAGLLFLDFATGSMLQLTGRATIEWDTEDVKQFPGARQLVSFEIDEIVELGAALKLRWQENAEAARSLRLVEKKRESKDVTSFVFEARDGGSLANFEAGQHLPIELDVPDAANKISRTYSLSGSPTDDRYRISVKREPKGLASRFLHDKLQVGAIVESRKPSGEFMVTCANCPLVLVSAGIGITPLLSILHKVAQEQGDRPVWFVHGTRDGDHHPFRDEIKELAGLRSNICMHTFYSQPLDGDVPGLDFEDTGRVTAQMLSKLVNRADAHYYLCGPAAFMAQIKSGLEDALVPDMQIHYETF